MSLVTETRPSGRLNEAWETAKIHLQCQYETSGDEKVRNIFDKLLSLRI